MKIFDIEPTIDTRPIREWTKGELMAELSALRMDMRKGFPDHDAMHAVELEIQKRR